MLKILTYGDLYTLGEELQNLVGGRVQNFYNPTPLRFLIEVRAHAESRLLVLDLTPATPFIVSISSTKIKNQSQKTPILNFFRSHFVGLRILSLEIAQKPNRTIRIRFQGVTLSEDGPSLLFKCFPHGQHLVLQAEGKTVQFPLRPRDEEEVTFIEPEKVRTWDINSGLAEQVMSLPKESNRANENYQSRLIKKLEKALTSLEKGMKEQVHRDQERIKVLEDQAQAVKGHELDGLFTEIKRLKKKGEISQLRKQELGQQLEKAKNNSLEPTPEEIIQSSHSFKRKKESVLFSGTKIRLGAQWELWVGRAAWQNDDLLRLASPHDLWFHLRDYPGAHGVLRGPKNSQPASAQIETACQIVAQFSQSKKSPFREGEKLDVIVTPKKFVKKRKGDPPGRVVVERETIRRIAFKIQKFEVI